MRRREFLFGSAGMAGYILPLLARGQGIPCPPPTIQLDGTNPTFTSCGDAEADWESRISAPGVVWYHDFRNPAEVDLFRFVRGQGTDYDNALPKSGACRRITSDGITGGGCLELVVPANASPDCDWWRPFAPLTGATNGRGINDPAAGGSIALKSYPTSSWGAYDFRYGYYSHPNYTSFQRDGHEFYIQFRVKIDGTRWNAGYPDGKLAYIDAVNSNLHEIVLQSWHEPRFTMYTSLGGLANSSLYQPQGAHVTGEAITSYQPGNDGTYPATTTGNGFNFPPNEWVTVLLRIVPGIHVSSCGSESGLIAARKDSGLANHGITAWVARQGATSYSKIWDKQDYCWYYDMDQPGFNMLKFSTYMNAGGGPTAFYHRYDQVIFSRQFIACPGV